MEAVMSAGGRISGWRKDLLNGDCVTAIRVDDGFKWSLYDSSENLFDSGLADDLVDAERQAIKAYFRLIARDQKERGIYAHGNPGRPE